MQPTHVLPGLVVDDLDRATTWYADLLGRPADAVPMPSCHEWTLGDGITLQVVQNPSQPAGQGQLTLAVADLEASTAATTASFDEISEVPGVIRFTATRDPDGNQVILVEPA